MLNMERNPVTRDFDHCLSVADWEAILMQPAIKERSCILHALEKWYLSPDQTNSCKALGQQNGLYANYFNYANQKLGQIAAKHVKPDQRMQENGKDVFWPYAWVLISKKHGIRTFQLRQALIEAIRNLGLFSIDSDEKLNQVIRTTAVQAIHDFPYQYERREKLEMLPKTALAYPRDAHTAMNALHHARFQCEHDATHNTFARQIDGHPYMEAHHLVPLAFAEDYPTSLDVPENIVCLCSTCHNLIHYGKERQAVIEHLWQMRKEHLRAVGIVVTLPMLCKHYGIT